MAWRWWLAPLVVTALLVTFTGARADLDEYVKKPEPDFAWKIKTKKDNEQGTIYTLHLVSQKWQGIVWEHGLLVFQPTGAKPAATMLLLNTGGNPGGTSAIFGLELAKRIGAPVAVLFNIPNQPLFDGKKEDALIAETFVRYIEGGGKDDSWPLLFPMVKSVVKAMDALQAFSKQEWQNDLKDFVITGASKRGWTTWLTGAADKRVKAIAPMVIDTLNMPAQMENQVRSFGRYSEMIHDYEERKLLPMPDSAAAKKLWMMVDPYAYRERLTMPKLIVNGANDPYWTVDALNLYWDELKGDKCAVIVPNAGHNLQQQFADGRNDPLRSVTRAICGIAVFTRMQTNDKTMPRLKWDHNETQDGDLRLYVSTAPAPKAARLWVAQSDTRDFRKARWAEKPADITAAGKLVVGVQARPKQGYQALYGEVDFDEAGLTYSLATQVRVEKAK